MAIKDALGEWLLERMKLKSLLGMVLMKYTPLRCLVPIGQHLKGLNGKQA